MQLPENFSALEELSLTDVSSDCTLKQLTEVFTARGKDYSLSSLQLSIPPTNNLPLTMQSELMENVPSLSHFECFGQAMYSSPGISLVSRAHLPIFDAE